MPFSVIDTDALSEIFKGKNDHVAALARQYLAENETLRFSVVTRYEVLKGLRAIGATRQIDDFLALCDRSDVLKVTEAVFDEAARIWGELIASGNRIGDIDVLIAATALLHDVPVITRNIRHFSRIPDLTVVDWGDPPAAG